MKKSSLITVALASLVGLVACNKPAAKSKTETAIAVYMEKFYLDNFTDPKGNPYEMEASRGETTDDIFKNAYFFNHESTNLDTDKYYLMPDTNDSFAFVTEYFTEITDEELAGAGQDGNPIRDIVLNNTIVSAINSMFTDDGTIFSFDVAYVTKGIVELLDNDKDGVNDYGHSMWIDYNEDDPENFSLIIEFTSYIYKFEGYTTHCSIIEVAFRNYEEM